jgi:salicylate hydroxylase
MEDAAVLTACLSKTSNVNLAAAVYELVRKQRGEAIQDSALSQSKTLHLPPGPEQKVPDEKIRQAMRNKEVGEHSKNPDKWIDTEWQDFMWKTDVMRDTLDKWDEYVATIDEHYLHQTTARL